MNKHLKTFMEARWSRQKEEERIREEYFKNAPYRITQKRLDEFCDKEKELMEKHNPYEKNDPEWEKHRFQLETFPRLFPEFMKERDKLHNEYGLPTVGGMVELIKEGEE